MFPFDLMSNGISRGIWVAIHKNKPYLRASFDRHIFSPFYLCSEMRYNYVEDQEVWLKNIRPQCSYLGIDVLHL